MTRLELARLRATRAKRVLAAASAAGFLVTVGLARAAHPGQAAHATSTSTASSSTDSQVPQVQVPLVQTHVS
jgi:hypothetical protein